MAAALEREQIPQPSEAYQKEQLAGIALTARIGTFSGLPGKNVQDFCDNVDGLMSRYGLGSWEMADIVILQMRGDAATEVLKFLSHKAKFPNADHWCKQDAQEARAFSPCLATIAAVGLEGVDGYVAEVLHQPELARLLELNRVEANACLKAYLIQSLKITISVTQALKKFNKYTTEHGNVSMCSYFNCLRTACTKFHSVKYTQEQRQAAGYAALLESDLVEAAKGGMADQFQEYLESKVATENGAVAVATFDQIETAAIKWETSTKAGQRRFQKCKPVPMVSSFPVHIKEVNADQGEAAEEEHDIPRVTLLIFTVKVQWKNCISHQITAFKLHLDCSSINSKIEEKSYKTLIFFATQILLLD